MLGKIKTYYSAHPISCIILVAFAVRLLAVFFAKGFGMHDDHFLIIDTARSWADGQDVQAWLPSSQENPIPQGHSFLCPGVQFLLFKFLHLIGCSGMEFGMWVTRFLLAVLSLGTVYFGYKISCLAYGKKVAVYTAWVLALFWAWPWLSVRNLVEIISIPFLMCACWLYMKNVYREKENLAITKEGFSFRNMKIPAWYIVLASGLLFGVAFSFRFQTLFFAGGFGLALLFLRRWRDFFVWGVGFVLSVLLVQGGIDMFVWGRPFAEFTEYVRYNLGHSGDYPNSPWYMYLLFLMGLLIPPVSLGLLAGFFAQYKNLLLFLPTFSFLFFHSVFPNKQERFILTIVPFIILLGIGGWNMLYERWLKPHKAWRKVVKICIIWAIVVNFLLLPFVSVHYSKRSRVEPMLYLSRYEPINIIVSENTNADDIKMLPITYLMQYPQRYKATRNNPLENLKAKGIEPDFILFEKEDNLEARVAEAKRLYPNLVYEARFTPSLVDYVMHKINRHNENFVVNVYRNASKFPNAVESNAIQPDAVQKEQ